MKSFLLSGLKRVAASGKAAFLSQHDADWIVWEPGSWKAPRAQTLVLESVKDAGSTTSGTAKGAEALAIALPHQGRVVIGRAPDADISINDATLSGRHFELVRDADGKWTADELGSTNGTTVETMTLRAGMPIALRNGSPIKAGQVSLTFHTAEGLWKRLSGET